MKRRNISTIAAVLYLSTVTLVSIASQAMLPNDLASFFDKMLDNHYNPVVTSGLGSFTFEDTQLPTPFARWFEDEIRSAATITQRMKLFDKRIAAAMDPSLRRNYEEFIKNGMVDSLIYGNYRFDGNAIKVKISLTDLGTGQLIAQAEYRLSQDVVPAYAAVKPSVQAVQTATSLSNLAGNQSGDPTFTISIATDRGAGATYKTGELMTLLFSSSKDAYVKIYHVSAQGVAQLIWPNRYGGSGRIKAGENLTFPGPGDTFRFVMTPPYGTEYIKAIASTVPFASQEADFSDLSGDARQAITRGISVVSTQALTRAEALAVYEILP